MEPKIVLQLLQILTDFAVAHGKRPSEEASISLLNKARGELTELFGGGAIVDACYDLMCKVRAIGLNHAVELAGKDQERDAAVAAEKARANMAISEGLADFQRDEVKVRNLEQQVQTLQAFAQSVKQFEDLRKSIAEQAGRLIG